MSGLDDLLKPAPKSEQTSQFVGGLDALLKPAPRESAPPRPRQAPTPASRNTVESLGHEVGTGEEIYRTSPDAIVDAISKAEGVPSHGNMKLASQYGGHERVPEDVETPSPGHSSNVF